MKRYVAVALALALGGCANLFAVHHGEDLDDNNVYFVDAEQRALVSGDVDFDRVFCAEPSPDSISALAAGLSGNLSEETTGQLQAAFTQSESAAYVGLRTPTIQLLRDGMYRLCEGFMNGTIDARTYAVMLNRYQQMMVGLVAIEQLTGPLRTQPVVLNAASVNASAQSNNLAEARATLNMFDTRIKAARETQRTHLASAPPADASDASKEAHASEQARLVAEYEMWFRLVERQGAIVGDIQKAAQDATSASITAGTQTQPGAVNPVAPTGSDLAAVASAVERITQNITSANVGEFACIPLFGAQHDGPNTAIQDRRDLELLRQGIQPPPRAPNGLLFTAELQERHAEQCINLIALAAAVELLERSRTSSLSADERALLNSYTASAFMD